MSKSCLTMFEIISSGENIAAIISDISTARHEQYIAIMQVNQAIRKMDQIKQNVAQIERAVATAGNLDDEAEMLIRKVTISTPERVLYALPVQKFEWPMLTISGNMKENGALICV